METFAIVFFALAVSSVALIIRLVSALIIADTVTKKGYTLSETHAFAKCFFFGIPGYCYIIALPDKNAQKTAARMAFTLESIERRLKSCCDEAQKK